MARPLDLNELRNRLKKDPTGYFDEFLLQYQHFQTQLQIFLLKPSEDYKPFSELVEFLSHVSEIYKNEMKDFPQQIADLLEKNCDILTSALRKSLVKALILLRNKNLMTPFSVLSLFFRLFRSHDKGLRELLYSHIVSDITKINKKSRNENLNRALQNFMYTMLSDPSETAAKKSLDVMIALFRKQIWNDIKTVNVISSGCFSRHTKIMVASLKFFLTIAEDDEEEKLAADAAEAKETVMKLKLKMNVRKMNHNRKRKWEGEMEEAKKAKEIKRNLAPNWPAIELIHDPQGYAEKIFGLTKRCAERFEVRLMLMNFVSRLIFTHKLSLLNFYPFVQKYLLPSGNHVTYAMAVLAQSTHDMIPPDVLTPVIRHIVDKFITDRSSVESILAGLNTIREMSARNPLIINPELLKDLTQYKTHRDKGIQSAARGLIGVYRQHDSNMLARRDRGREATENPTKPKQFGESEVASGVADIELLERIEILEKLQAEKENEKQPAKKKGKKAAEDDEDDEGEWEEVSDADDDDDDDDEEEEEQEIVQPKKKSKKNPASELKVSETGVVEVMSLADALKLQSMQEKFLNKQIDQLKSKKGVNHKAVNIYNNLPQEIDDDGDDDEDDDEDEDEDEEEDEQEEEEADIWAEISAVTEENNKPKQKGKTSTTPSSSQKNNNKTTPTPTPSTKSTTTSAPKPSTTKPSTAPTPSTKSSTTTATTTSTTATKAATTTATTNKPSANTTAKPAANNKAAAADKPVAADNKTTAADKPVAANNKAAADKPAASNKPVVNKPAANNKAAAADKPAANNKAAAADKPAAGNKPVAADSKKTTATAVVADKPAANGKATAAVVVADKSAANKNAAKSATAKPAANNKAVAQPQKGKAKYVEVEESEDDEPEEDDEEDDDDGSDEEMEDADDSDEIDLENGEWEEVGSDDDEMMSSSDDEAVDISTIKPAPSGQRMDANRILTEADFEKLNKLKQMKEDGQISLKRLREQTDEYMKADSDEEEEQNVGMQGIISAADLLKGMSKPKQTKEQKMIAVMEGRKDRPDNYRKKEKQKYTTNQEKTKNKNLMMMMKSTKVISKRKLSMHDRQYLKSKGNKKHKMRRFK